MWNEPTPDRLAKIPPLYGTENIPFDDKIIFLHFFIPGKDMSLEDAFQSFPHSEGRHRFVLLNYSFHWYIAEYDGDDLFYGFANLGDPQMAEWGYISFAELRDPGPNGIHVIHDTLWTPRRFSEVMQTQSFVKE